MQDKTIDYYKKCFGMKLLRFRDIPEVRQPALPLGSWQIVHSTAQRRDGMGTPNSFNGLENIKGREEAGGRDSAGDYKGRAEPNGSVFSHAVPVHQEESPACCACRASTPMPSWALAPRRQTLQSSECLNQVCRP